MGRVFRFSVSFRTSPREVCWSGMGWLHMGRWRVKHYISLGWFAVLRFHRPDSILSKHARLVARMSIYVRCSHSKKKKVTFVASILDLAIKQAANKHI